MDKILLISETNLKENSLVQLNVDTKILAQTILQSQFTQLRPVLGDTLYNKVLDDVKQTVNDSGYSQQYKELLEGYIQPYLTVEVQRNLIINLSYRLTNKGILKYTDSNASTLGSSDTEYVKNYFDNLTSSYKVALIDYLHDNNLIENCNTDNHIEGEATGWFLSGLGRCV